MVNTNLCFNFLLIERLHCPMRNSLSASLPHHILLTHRLMALPEVSQDATYTTASPDAKNATGPL